MAKKTARPGSSKKSKKSTTKKSAPKMSSSAKKLPAKPQKKSLEEQLRNEIRAMTRTLGAESLKKLLQDATILAHNERVLKDFNANSRPAAPRGQAVLAEVEEGRDGSYYIIILNSYRNFLSLDEMRKLVALCRKAGDARDAANRLYAWVETVRSDIKKNSMIADADDPSLPALWKIVVSGYALK